MRALSGAWNATSSIARTVMVSSKIACAGHRCPVRLHGVSEFVFGTHNAAFVQVMYEQYLRAPASVGEEWRKLFDNGKTAELPIIPSDRAEVLGRVETGDVPPVAAESPSPISHLPAGATPITGPAARLVTNMTESLTVPTATSFRDIAVGTLDARRKALNAQLAQLGPSGKKISFTHLIAFAIVQAVKQFPVMTHAFQEIDGKPHRVTPQGIGLGLAVDVERKDGSRGLVVPVIKHAEAMDFAAFHQTYEALVEKARTNKLLPDDFAGGTIQLTNPGTIGTVASVPRLMKGQGSIIATCAIRDIAGAKVMTISSTYDHRIIQGAESGSFLRRLEGLLQGEDGFYESVGAPQASAISGQPSAVSKPQAASVDDSRHVAAAMALVRAIRRLGHRAARLDPLGSPPPRDPSLDPPPPGLPPEAMARIPPDVLRSYVPGATLAEALPHLTATYCGTIAYEVEHIASPEERGWLRRVIESGEHRKPLAPADKRDLLTRLTLVDTLERFLQRP